MYDQDGDGYITSDELFNILVIMVGDNLNHLQLKQIVHKTIMYADTDDDGRISFPEFCRIVGDTGVPQVGIDV